MMNKKTIWITGGSTGIGKALAIKFATEGWNVAISARRENLLKEISNDNKGSSFKWAKDLFPICRSLTGEGNRKTLRYIKNINTINKVKTLIIRSYRSKGITSPILYLSNLITV